MFFSVLRSRFGYNNNPNAKQLKQALRGMLCMNTKCINTGNCTEQEGECLTRISALKTLNSICNDDMTAEENDEESTREDIELDMSVPSEEESSFINNIVTYISGYVVRKICSHSSCSKCICKLMADEKDVEKIASDCSLLLKRDQGGLIVPSHAVISVCKIAENTVRDAKTRGLETMKKSKLVDTILLKTQERGWTGELSCNDSEDSVSHVNNLVRQIASIYLTARLHHLAKESTLELCPVTLRSTCVNVVQFKGN